MMPNRTLSARSATLLSRQRGVVLFIALIALVAMTLAAIGLVRSHETGAMIAGNIAFKQSAAQNADVALEMALAALPAIVAASQEQNIANEYYALQQADNALGVPAIINWANIPCRTAGGAQAACSGISEGDYRLQYVIDRLCGGTLPVTDQIANCVTDKTQAPPSIVIGKTGFSKSDMVYYRITTRVQAPRNAASIVQAVVGYRKP